MNKLKQPNKLEAAKFRKGTSEVRTTPFLYYLVIIENVKDGKCIYLLYFMGL
jgi:hypothetical protein